MKNFSTFIKIGIGSVLALILYFYVKSSSYPSKYQITDISSHIQGNIPADYSGAVMVNLDDDEDEEIFVSGLGTSNLLLKHVGNDFVPISIPTLEDKKGYTFSVTACDLNQDGRDELLLLNSKKTEGEKSRIMSYVNHEWKDVLPSANELVEHLGGAYSATCIDRNGNGKYGLAVSHNNGKMLYLEMNGNEVKDIASEIGLGIVSKGRSVLGIPDAQGKTNIFVGNEGANFYFVNQGDGTFVDKAKAYGIEDANFSTRGISLIDYNQDDIIDVVYGNHFGPVRLLIQSRDGHFTDVTPEVMFNTYANNAIAVGDFNLDGYEDIYLNNIRNKNGLFAKFNKTWFHVDPKELSEKDYYGVSTIAGDLDHNGSYEILNTHGDGTKFRLTLYSIKPESKWIQFNVKFENGGVPRGATVRLRTTRRDQLKVISSGSGRFANYGKELIFGLLPDENVVALEVTLPSGYKLNVSKKLNILNLNEVIIPHDVKISEMHKL